MAEPQMMAPVDPFDAAVAQLVAALDDPSAVVTTRGQAAQRPRQTEVRAYHPTLIDQVGSWLMGDGQPSPERERLVSGLVGSTGLGTNRASVADITGLPTVERGVRHMGEGLEDGEASRIAGGAGEIALGALPGLAAARATRPMLNALMSSAPRTAATVVVPTAATLPMQIGDAQAASESHEAAALAADPEVRRLRNEIAKKQTERNEGVTRSVPGLNRQQGDMARDRLQAAIQADITALGQQLTEAQDRARASFRQNAPFRDRYPGAAESIAAAGGTMAFALPFANAVKHNLANRLVYDPAIRRQTATVETALNGDVVQPGMVDRLLRRPQPGKIARNADRFALEQGVLREQLAGREGLEVGPANYLMNAPMSMLSMQEARMVPEEVDAYAFPWGHATRDAAVQALTSPDYYASGAIPSVIGGGALGLAGTKVGDLVSRRAAGPDVDRARVLSRMDYATRRLEAEPGSSAAPAGPGRADRLKDAMTNRLVHWIEPRPGPAGPIAGAPSALPTPLPPDLSGGVQVPPTTRRPPPQPVTSNSFQPYRDPQKAVVRPFVESEVAAGRSVPDATAVGQEFGRTGVKAPTTSEFPHRLENASSLVAALRARGMADGEIASVLADLMRKNMPGLPAIAAGAAGLGALGSQHVQDF